MSICVVHCLDEQKAKPENIRVKTISSEKNPLHWLNSSLFFVSFLPLKNPQTTFNNDPFIIQRAFYSEPVSGCDSFCPFSGSSLFHSAFKCSITHLVFSPCYCLCFLWKENPVKFPKFRLCVPLTERAATLLILSPILLKPKLFLDTNLYSRL